MTEKTIQSLIPQILVWGKEKGLHSTTDLQPQFIKLVEEQGELAAGIARQDAALILDAVGDMLVVLIQFGAVFVNHMNAKDEADRQRLTETFLLACLNRAWHEIRNRTGKTKDGVFVKEVNDGNA